MPLAVVLLTMFGSGLSSAQTSPGSQQPASPQMSQGERAAMGGGMMRGMMAEHQAMMAEAKAMDQKLDELVATMNAAEGPAKLDAIAAVVNELVVRRTLMRDRMMMMQDRMMQQMMSMMSGMEKPGSTQEGAGTEKEDQAPDPAATHKH
ncbi:MAG TPA: hypothetical protein VM818_05105 [Vicinamibacterales bacterium]|nr:hypothetical protein [Vicinamibacterales bacterium]